MDHSKRIAELEEKIREANDEIYRLKQENNQWFIGKLSIGDGDYWDDWYSTLGFISEAEADKWLDDQMNDNDSIWNGEVFPVTAETYDRYRLWKSYRRLLSTVINARGVVNSCKLSADLDVLNSHYEFYEERNEALALELTGYPSFSHIDED